MVFTKKKKAKILIVLSSILQFQGFIGPVLFVFYTAYMGLTTAQYLFVDSLLFFIMAVCEIPSGMIADRFGRKRVLVVAKIAICIGMIILLTMKSLEGAILVSIIYGIFGALESGITDSIFYELFERENSLEEYEFLTAKTGGIGFIISILYGVIAGYVTDKNLALPVILDLMISVAMLICILIFLEDNGEYKAKDKLFLPTKKQLGNVLPILLVFAMISSCSRIMYSFYQPVLIEEQFPIIFLGYASGIYSITASCSSFLYEKIRTKLDEKGMYCLILIVQLIATFGFAFSGGYVVIIFILIQQLQRGFTGTFLYMQANQYISSKDGNRVTIMSILFCSINLITASSLFLTSYVTKYYGLDISIVSYVFVANFLFLDFLGIFAYKKYKKQIEVMVE